MMFLPLIISLIKFLFALGLVLINVEGAGLFSDFSERLSLNFYHTPFTTQITLSSSITPFLNVFRKSSLSSISFVYE